MCPDRGRGRFADVTEAWGLTDQHGKTLGVAFADVNEDGFPDLYLANDEVLVANVSDGGLDCRRHNNNNRLDTRSIQHWINDAVGEHFGDT